MASEQEPKAGPGAPRSPQGTRLVAIGEHTPREFPLDKPRVAIGSSRDNDLILTDSTVSRRHARIRRRLGRFRIADADSTNGTFVNGRRLSATAILKRGDEVRFGAVRFAFVGGPPRRIVAALSRIAALMIVFGAGFVAVQYGRNWYQTRTTRDAAEPQTQPSASTEPIAAASAESARAVASPAAAMKVSAPEPAWLARLNYYRAMTKLAPISEDPALSAADAKHAIYLVKNYAESMKTGVLGPDAHNEDASNPWYSPEGLAAAKSSDVEEWYIPGRKYSPALSDPDNWTADRGPGTPAWSIDGWIAIPFHRLPILSPQLRRAGYAISCEEGACAAALNVLPSRTINVSSVPAHAPVEFPPDGSTIALRSFGAEWPDPRASCPGYQAPSGLAITIQLGPGAAPRLGAYSIARVDASAARSPVEACGFDAAGYRNADAHAQRAVHDSLVAFGAVVVVPRAPLERAAKYAVSMTLDDKQYAWSFSTAP